jgi:predicted nucleotide-binding protein (sugar kinase/HSP70/actin superfamily)
MCDTNTFCFLFKVLKGYCNAFKKREFDAIFYRFSFFFSLYKSVTQPFYLSISLSFYIFF